MSITVSEPAPAPSTSGDDASREERARLRIARRVAMVAGLLGFVLAALTPVLPVTQTTAQLNWPQDHSLNAVTAPLVSYAPTELDLSVPCEAVDRLAQQPGNDNTVLLSTAPKQAAADAYDRALFVTAKDGTVSVHSRNTLIAQAPLAQVGAGKCTAIDVSATADRVTATFAGLAGQDGKDLTGTVSGSDLRPQVVGVFTDLTGAVPQGLSFHATVDSRYSSVPSPLKWLAMIGGAVLTCAALVALARLDRNDGRRRRRLVPAHWLRFDLKDTVVFAALIIWHIIGANTSDDGYELGMARAAEHSGYLANYFRWYGAPEAPFGDPYYVFAWLSHLSPASVLLRIPTLIAAILCWILLSREVIPRFGRLARRGDVAYWTAALVLLAFWFPYNNGLRPEPLIATGALLTWCAVERAIATGRLFPAAVALLVAGFTLSAGPTGTICIAALLAGSRPLIQILVRRARRVGFTALIAPLLASAALVLVLVFGNASLGPVMMATKMKGDVGPSNSWYEEIERYNWLMNATPDGSIARRFAVLVMLLCLVTCIVVLYRRTRLGVVAAGPARRIVGATALSLLFMMFNPTKWTHHFGVYAGLAAALAGLTAVIVGPHVLRSARNRTLFAAAVLFVLAVSFESKNAWWYVSSFGIPFGGKMPELMGIKVSTVFLVLTATALVAALWFHCREPYVRARRTTTSQHPSRVATVVSAPLTAAVALLVVFQVASMAAGVVNQYPAYSVGLANARALAGHPCNLADDVLVETDPNAGMLHPVAAVADPLGAVARENFTPDGLPTDLSSTQQASENLINNPSSKSNGNSAGTGGGLRPTAGVNGSHMILPFGLDPATTPVLGSYQTGDLHPARAVSAWYRLPARSENTPLLAISAAGQVTDTNLQIEYGQQVDGQYKPIGKASLIDIGPAPSWRTLRLPMSSIPAPAQVVRIVADVRNPAPDQWIAFTPPRMPQLQTLQHLVGAHTPILLDWPVPLAFTCQQQLNTRDGVAQLPQYRILANGGLPVVATNWEGPQGGGPVGWAQLLLSSQTLPTYLDHDWSRDWGSLERYTPLVPGARTADLELGTATRSGLWNPAPIQHQQ